MLSNSTQEFLGCRDLDIIARTFENFDSHKRLLKGLLVMFDKLFRDLFENC